MKYDWLQIVRHKFAAVSLGGVQVKVMVVVLSKGDKLISKEAGSRMVNIVKHLSGIVPKAVMDDAMKDMAQDEKENLQAFAME